MELYIQIDIFTKDIFNHDEAEGVGVDRGVELCSDHADAGIYNM